KSDPDCEKTDKKKWVRGNLSGRYKYERSDGHYQKAQCHSIFKSGFFKNDRRRKRHDRIGYKKSESHQVRTGIVKIKVFLEKRNQRGIHPGYKTKNKEEDADNNQWAQIVGIFVAHQIVTYKGCLFVLNRLSSYEY